MSINISNLNAAGSELFAGTDSFMTELQTTETTQIFGGYKQRCGGRKWKKTSWKGKKTSYKGKKTSWKTSSKCKPVRCFVPTRPSC